MKTMAKPMENFESLKQNIELTYTQTIPLTASKTYKTNTKQKIKLTNHLITETNLPNIKTQQNEENHKTTIATN